VALEPLVKLIVNVVLRPKDQVWVFELNPDPEGLKEVLIKSDPTSLLTLSPVGIPAVKTGVAVVVNETLSDAVCPLLEVTVTVAVYAVDAVNPLTAREVAVLPEYALGSPVILYEA